MTVSRTAMHADVTADKTAANTAFAPVGLTFSQDSVSSYLCYLLGRQ
ncbi:MAG TPA: hypothetical protein VII99_11415 [Bacteroidia bacterium]